MDDTLKGSSLWQAASLLSRAFVVFSLKGAAVVDILPLLACLVRRPALGVCETGRDLRLRVVCDEDNIAVFILTI